MPETQPLISLPGDHNPVLNHWLSTHNIDDPHKPIHSPRYLLLLMNNNGIVTARLPLRLNVYIESQGLLSYTGSIQTLRLLAHSLTLLEWIV